MNELESLRETYLAENEELLKSMEDNLLLLENDPDNDEAINALFRSVHTIKGTSGIMSNTNVGEFTHVLENFLDKVKKGQAFIDSNLIAILLSSHDHIQDLLDFDLADENTELNENLKLRGEEILNALSNYSSEENKELNENIKLKESDDEDDSAKMKNKNWQISLHCHEDFFENGFDPLSFIQFLRKSGEILDLRVLPAKFPEGDLFDAEKCYLGFEIAYQTDNDYKEVEETFDFVFDLAYISILKPDDSFQNFYKSYESHPHKSTILSIWQSMKLIDQEEITLLQDYKLKKVDSTTKVKSTKSVSVNKNNKKERIKKKFIRVDSEKLDSLINLVGELVITNSNLKNLAEKNEDAAVTEIALDLTRLVEEIRESSMDIRMVDIGSTFKQYERVVRDLSKQEGKEVELVTEGNETELDKTIIEKINDPLIHLVRNAVDHGIGLPEEREQAGKSRKGRVTLNAYPDMGNIVIEVSDDGRGLNKNKILEKAIEKGIATDDRAYSEKEIFNFIFEPGFSTAKKVTNVSGRGVGLDVVKKNIEMLRGSVTLHSVAEQGSTFKIILPLTLAIIDGFLVQIGKQFFIIPLDVVQETIDLPKINNESNNKFINLRGDVLPLLDLNQFFEIASTNIERRNIVVIKLENSKAGLIVDSIIGEFQTVIKPLGKIFDKLRGISGSTILGSGDVALILDAARLIARVKDNE